MDKFWSVVGNMTFWNWIALIAFLIALMSGLNAFLTLRSRYRDWRGTRSKKAFEKRTRDLGKKIQQLTTYKENPTTYFFFISNFIVRCLVLILLSLSFSNLAFLLNTRTDVYSLLSARVMSGIATLWVLVGVIKSFRLVPLLIAMQTPSVLAMEVIDFVRKGFKKGLTSTEADSLIISMASSEMFTGTDKQVLFDYIGKNYPQVLSTIMAKSKTGNSAA